VRPYDSGGSGPIDDRLWRVWASSRVDVVGLIDTCDKRCDMGYAIQWFLRPK
jgi:hypothetical protein